MLKLYPKTPNGDPDDTDRTNYDRFDHTDLRETFPGAREFNIGFGTLLRNWLRRTRARSNTVKAFYRTCAATPAAILTGSPRKWPRKTPGPSTGPVVLRWETQIIRTKIVRTVPGHCRSVRVPI